MTKTIRVLSAAALAGSLALSLTASASAQDAPPPSGAVAGQAHHWDPAKMRARMDERRQRHDQILHDALGIRADQEAAWQAFNASRRPPEGERGPGMHRPGGEGDGQHAELTTPQRLDRMAQRMSERQARFAQRAAATKAFYAVLDPRQQKTFDALVMSRMGHGGMGGWGGHHGHMGGWGHGDQKGPPGPPPPAGERG